MWNLIPIRHLLDTKLSIAGYQLNSDRLCRKYWNISICWRYSPLIREPMSKRRPYDVQLSINNAYDSSHTHIIIQPDQIELYTTQWSSIFIFCQGFKYRPLFLFMKYLSSTPSWLYIGSTAMATLHDEMSIQIGSTAMVTLHDEMSIQMQPHGMPRS